MDSSERNNQQEHRLVHEMMRNERNRKIMFEEKFPRHLHLQSQLKLNNICQSEDKKVILSYLKSPEVLLKLMEQLKKDEVTSSVRKTIILVFEALRRQRSRR